MCVLCLHLSICLCACVVCVLACALKYALSCDWFIVYLRCCLVIGLSDVRFPDVVLRFPVEVEVVLVNFEFRQIPILLAVPFVIVINIMQSSNNSLRVVKRGVNLSVVRHSWWRCMVWVTKFQTGQVQTRELGIMLELIQKLFHHEL